MAGLDDITKKAQEFLANDKVKDVLKSGQAEGISDDLLDRVADAANTATGGRFHDQIDHARHEADKKIGNE